jgi:hypothetical protein
MDDRAVIGVADLADAADDTLRISNQFLARETDVALDLLKRGVRQQFDALQDHAVDHLHILLVTGGEDRQGCRRDVAAIFAGDDLGHRAMAGERAGMQQRLRQPVPKRRVERPAIVLAAVDLLGERAECVDRAAAQSIAQNRAQKIDMIFGAEQRVAAGDARQDHVHAVAERDLAVLEQEHDRNRGAGLHDAREAGADGRAGISEAIGLGARFHRREIAVEKTRPPGNGDHIGDFHSPAPHTREPLTRLRASLSDTLSP